VFDSFINNKKKFYSTQTFTYYIPSPPPRKTGYRETEFDSVISKIVSLGYEVISLNSQSHASEDKSGMWIICHLGAPTKEIANKEIIIDDNKNETINSKIELDPSIIHEL
jgi:hypothetical protein